MKKFMLGASLISAIVAIADPIGPIPSYKLNRFHVLSGSDNVDCDGRDIIVYEQGKVFLTVEGSGTLSFQWSAPNSAGQWAAFYCDDWNSVRYSPGGYREDYKKESVSVSGEGLHTMAWTVSQDRIRYFPVTCYIKDVEWNGVPIPLNLGPYVTATPVIQPQSGSTFEGSATVLMTDANSHAKIYYTLDGTEPTTNSIPYKKFKIYGKTIVKAIALDEGWQLSGVATAMYALGQCADPVITPEDGTVFEHSGQKVSLAHDNPEGVLRYTTDGSDPTIESAEYVGPFTIDETTTIKAKVFGDQYFDSSIVTATLTRVWVKLPVPVITAQEAFTGSQQRVDIVCATEGATVRYTTDGTNPNSDSPEYTKPFYVTDTTTVKAYATKVDYTDSDIATFAIAKVWGIGDTMGKPDHAFATSGDKGFVRVEDATATLKESMKSGAIGNDQKSILSTTVIGPGTLTFKWKASCEDDGEDYEWDHGEFRVNGEPKGWVNGVTDWVSVSQRIEGDGEHTVTWTYVKDENESVEQDCIWVSDYAWASDYTETQTTQVPVPYDWLMEKSRDIVDEYENYEKVAKQTAYNPRFTVEQCYVAGLDPESTTNEFTATIGPDLSIGWKPDLKAERNYKVWGSTNLVNGGDWEYPTNALHRFFKVTVEMP